MAIHCSILIQKIPWTEEPDRLQLMGSQSHMTDTHTRTYMYSGINHQQPWETNLSVYSAYMGEGNGSPLQSPCEEN